ncbi:MAG: glycosyltransferase family 2 protein [Chloroflexi bacterium]|nr:glycosyltransferase family 2 protein [Chloroflexota bacterium]
MSEPGISVIVASYNSLHTIRACLKSLRGQDSRSRFEVIVVDSSTDGTGEVVKKEFPEVILVGCSNRKFPGAARNMGVARARGNIICFLDSDCIAFPDWLAKIEEAHARSDPVIGGCVDNAARSRAVGWASYFTEFSWWMPGTQLRRLPEVPACALTFKRSVLDEMGPMDEWGYSEDSAYLWQMRQAGYAEPLFDPTIMIAHDGITEFPKFIAHEVFHGQSYGQVRASLHGWGLIRRLAYTLAAPLIYVVLCARVTLRVFRARIFIKQFVGAIPLVYLGLLGWSLGEALGYLRGPR